MLNLRSGIYISCPHARAQALLRKRRLTDCKGRRWQLAQQGWCICKLSSWDSRNPPMETGGWQEVPPLAEEQLTTEPLLREGGSQFSLSEGPWVGCPCSSGCPHAELDGVFFFFFIKMRTQNWEYREGDVDLGVGVGKSEYDQNALYKITKELIRI